MRFLKIAGIVIGALLLLAIGAAVLITVSFDPNDYKDDAARLFEARTGRTLAIEDDLSLSFFPWLAVETGRVTVGHSADFPAPADGRPFATVERAAARVRLRPLLERRIEIGVVELEGLELELARDAELRGNWEDLLTRRAADETAAPDGDEAAVETFEIAGVRVRDGVVRWRENVDELRYTIAGIELETGAIGSGRPVEVALGLTFRDESVSLAATVEASATAELGDAGAFAARGLEVRFGVADAEIAERARGTLRAAAVTGGAGNPIRIDTLALDATLAHPLANGRRVPLAVAAAAAAYDPDADTLAFEDLRTEAGAVAADWQLDASSLLTAPQVGGTVRASGDMAELLALAGLEAPVGIDPRTLGPFSAAATFAWRQAPAEVRIGELDVDAVGVRIRGEGSLAGERLAGRIDIPELVPNETLKALLRTAVPPTVDVEAIDRLAIAARFDADLATQQASIRELSANVFGAAITGELEALPGANGSLFRGAVKTSRFDPAKLAQAFRSFLPDTIDPAELGMLELDARFALDAGADTVSFAPFSAEVFGLRGSGELAGSAISSAAVWNGRVSVEPFSPRALMQRFGQAVPQTSDPTALGRAAIDTRFAIDVARETSRFENLTLMLDDTRITGQFTVSGFADPRYSFALAIDSVDADRYLPPPADEAEAGQKTAGDIELPTESPLVLDGRVEVGSLKLANLSFADVSTSISLGNGDAKLESARARLYGGEFAGSFHAITSTSSPGLRLQGRASNLTLEPLIEALTGEPANFTGTGSFDLDLSGQGQTVIDNVRTAGGNVAFTLENGAVRGFNLGHALCAAYNALERQPAPPEQPRATEYALIRGTATVANGVAASNDLLARASFMDVTGRGTLVLVEQRLDYDLEATLTGRIEIPNCQTMERLIGGSIPLDIRGTVTEPEITPDFSEIIKRRVESELRDRIQDRLQDRLRDLLR